MRRVPVLLLAAVLLPLALLAQAPQTAPAPLAREVDLAHKYARFRSEDTSGNWQVLETLPTSKADDEKKWAVENGQISITDDGLFIQATAGVGAFATVAGRTFKGPLGIRYEAMAPADSDPSDLSIRFGPPDNPERIQFCVGAYQNTENSAIIGEDRRRNLGGPLIVPGKWLTVELCYQGDRAIGKIDGQIVMDEKLPIPITAETEHEVALYTWAANGTFRKVRLLKYVPVPTPPKKWADFLGTATEDDLKKMAAAVAPLLGNDDFRQRRAAEEVLWNLHPLSDAAILEQTKSQDPEARGRAETLARKAGLLPPESPPAPATPAPDAAPGNLNGAVFINGNVIQLVPAGK